MVKEDYVLSWCAAIVCVLLGLAFWAAVQQSRECKAAGGQMLHDGTFTYVWQPTDGKGNGVLVPHPNYKCKLPE